MRSTSSGGRRLSLAALENAKATVAEKDVNPTRKELADAGRAAMRALDLRPGWRLILSELIGCWGETMVAGKILVWPSNAYLVERTGLSERTVRYAIRGLVDCGLLAPKDSANGKRFSIKGANGALLHAFGFDLTPILSRRVEWKEKLAGKELVTQARRRLFDDITICRRAVEEVIVAFLDQLSGHDCMAIAHELAEIQSVTPRRGSSTSDEFLTALLGRYQDLRRRAEQAFYQTGCGGNSDRHIESINDSPIHPTCNQEGLSNEIGSGENSSPATLLVALVVEACPALAEYVEPINSPEELIAAARIVRGAFGAHPSAWEEGCQRIGALRAAAAAALTLQLHVEDQAGRIRNPGGYFRAMIRTIEEGRFDLEAELLALRRRHLK